MSSRAGHGANGVGYRCHWLRVVSGAVKTCHFLASVRLLGQGINLAPMAGGAVNKMSVGIRRQVLHLQELLVNRKMHQGHVASTSFGPLVVLREVIRHMTMLAVNAQRAAVSLVHDQKESCGGNLLQEIDLNILKDLPGLFLLVSGNLLGNLLDESVINFLIGRLLGCLRRRDWRRLLQGI